MHGLHVNSSAECKNMENETQNGAVWDGKADLYQERDGVCR